MRRGEGVGEKSGAICSGKAMVGHWRASRKHDRLQDATLPGLYTVAPRSKEKSAAAERTRGRKTFTNVLTRSASHAKAFTRTSG